MNRMKSENKHKSGTCLLGILLCLLGARPARAQLDPEADKPYQLQVVVRVAENRSLTPIFQEQLRQALRAQLQLSLGPLAHVEVAATHPLLAEIEAKGLESGLDGWEQISGRQTHFVLVDFSAGIYVLKARQHDGMTGLRSPGVRVAQTSDRALVAQTAARLVEENFGLVGTVSRAGKDFEVVLKGGKLGVNLERRVGPGEVFAVSRITREGDRLRGTHVPWALLEVLDAPRAGSCRCRLYHRFQEDDLRDRAGVLGYRCLKLATTPGPLKLQLVDDENFLPLAGVRVHVLKPGSTIPAEECTTNQDGLVVSRSSYRHFVLAKVLGGAGARAQFPVALLGERTVVCRLKAQADAENLTALEIRKDQWMRRILDNRRVVSDLWAHLNSELNKSLEATLELARAGLKSIDGEWQALALEHEQLMLLAKPSARLDLREGELGLEALGGKKKELEAFIQRNEIVLTEATSPAALANKKLLERAGLFEAEHDFDQAIALLEQVLQASPDQPKVKERLDGLKEAWTPKNPRHAEARAFLIKTWPKMEVAELHKNLSRAREALDICKEAADRLTPLRVLQAIADHTANVQKELTALKRQNSIDAAPQAKLIAQVVAGLRQLHGEALAAAGKK